MNYKHLHYFWVAARAGGVVRAGEQLHTTPQTLSGQIKLLEDRLGKKLFKKRGRNLELTDAGRLAIGYADEIFALGSEMETALRQGHDASRVLEFRVGVSDSVSKSIACRLLEPAWLQGEVAVRLICDEGKLRDLLARLAVNRLDLVIADEPMPRPLGIKAFNHALGGTGLSFFAAPPLHARLQGPFPGCLHGAPMLIPGREAPIRPRLEQWFIASGVQPRIVGEFDDGALMKTFAQEGRGVFASPSVLEAETCAEVGVQVLGRGSDLLEEFYAISAERRITHPCVAAITRLARGRLFGDGRGEGAAGAAADGGQAG